VLAPVGRPVAIGAPQADRSGRAARLVMAPG
jgi:hypothetical protein